ncbi:MAG: methylenetetrahydrofolate reductase [Candidatus Omnitrophica bacterium]|nr:methylenetetrahydrofolate reductase [Candidatus Omnitrophota bacterium]
MNFQEKLNKGKFLITSEITPPKGTNVHSALESANFLKDKVDAINVTDMAGGVMRLSSLCLSYLIKQKGGEPIFQITASHRNRLALQSDILATSVLGIENVLVLSGDPPSYGDQPSAKPVFDLNSIEILEMIDKMEKGCDLAGKELKGSPKFFCGAAVDPNAANLDFQINKMEKKVKAGAKFFQTQPIFDIAKFAEFMKKVEKFNVPVLGGIIFLKNEKTANYLNKNIAGISIPQEIMQRIEKAADKERETVNIASELIKQIKPLCQGVHLMPLGKNDLVKEVVEGID